MGGHERVSLMNGGRLKWEQEGRELTTDPTEVESTTYEAGEADPSLRILQPDVRAALGDGSTVLVDVRSPAEFNWRDSWLRRACRNCHSAADTFPALTTFRG